MTRSEPGIPPVVDRPAALSDPVRAAPGLLLGLDFDGTLAPIVADPDEATASPEVVGPLARLAAARNVSVAVVSGRALDDLVDRVPVDGVVLAGNHGLELYRDGEREVVAAAADASDAIERVRNRLATDLDDIPGCRIEDKGLTLSVHVRETPSEEVQSVREAVESVVEKYDELRLSSGKAVFEIRLAVDRDKGTAMADLAATVPDDWLAIYVGDDTTDEDAFRALQPGGIGIHVGEDPDTAATFSLEDQTAVAPLLRWLSVAGPVEESSEKDDG